MPAGRADGEVKPLRLRLAALHFEPEQCILNVDTFLEEAKIMTTKIQQWGNSLALRIPKSFAKDIHLAKGAPVDLSVNGGRLVIDPSPQPKYSLSALLEKVKKNNLHRETGSGNAVGREIW